MAVSLQKRALDRLLRALGHDHQLGEQPLLDTSRIVLTANVDDLRFAHSAAGYGRMWATVIPSVAAGTFSGLEFTPDEGLWIRELTGSVNWAMTLSFGGSPSGAYTVADALANAKVVIGRPEDTDFPAVLQTTFATITGATGAPKIFRDVQIGQAAAGPIGMFSFPQTVWRDLYVPAGATMSMLATAANTAINFQMQLELISENFFT